MTALEIQRNSPDNSEIGLHSIGIFASRFMGGIPISVVFKARGASITGYVIDEQRKRRQKKH